MMLALERISDPELGRPTRPKTGAEDPGWSVSVIFTSVDATLQALRRAAVLAANLRARITLLVPQVVPFPLPLESPPVLLGWSERRFHVIADQSPVETTVHIYLCRDPLTALISVLHAGSLVIVGSRRRWWPTKEERLACKLRKLGHEVIVAPVE